MEGEDVQGVVGVVLIATARTGEVGAVGRDVGHGELATATEQVREGTGAGRRGRWAGVGCRPGRVLGILYFIFLFVFFLRLLYLF